MERWHRALTKNDAEFKQLFRSRFQVVQAVGAGGFFGDFAVGRQWLSGIAGLAQKQPDSVQKEQESSADGGVKVVQPGIIERAHCH